SWHCAAAEAGLAAGLGVPPVAGAAEATFAGAAPAAGWPGWGSDVAAWPAGAAGSAQGVGNHPSRAATATAHSRMTDTAAVATSGCRPCRGAAPGEDTGLFMVRPCSTIRPVI